jgi:hypothetical protein
MRLLAKRRARKAEEERIAAAQAACDHDWKRVEKVKGAVYYTFRCMLLPDRSSTALKYQCQKCGKVEWDAI